VEIKPNETVFVIPLEGESKEGQAKFQSVEFLEGRKVATKRVYIPQKQHNTGRTPGDYTWIPTVEVVRVDRSPVTREWTKGKDTGTSTKDQAITVESQDSINFRAGVNITVSIQEDDAAKFLYYFHGKPLPEVVDTNIRGYVQTVLAREFGQKDLTLCMKEKSTVFRMCFEETQKYFKEKGITVDYLGSSEGLSYDEPKIQDAINKRFVAENDIEVAKQEKLAQEERNKITISKARAEAEALIEVAKQEKLAQDVRNQTLLAKAQSERQAAEELAKAQDAMQLKVELEVKKTLADAQKTAAEKWQGNVPSTILPQGSNLLFGLDAPRTATAEPAAKPGKQAAQK
jgi:hypothetical protein